MTHCRKAVLCLPVGLLLLSPCLHAASFDGQSRVEIADPSGALSLSNNTLTVLCWLKMSIPSGVTLTDHLTVLADRTSGNEATDPYSYLIRYNIWEGNLEFLANGASAFSRALVERPFLDRWYHVAVVRNGDQFTGYVDGREVFVAPGGGVGDTGNANGVCIGGWGEARYFRGEIQEVAIYSTPLPPSTVAQHMFADQRNVPGLRGYYKLGWSEQETDWLQNFAPAPPAGTELGVKAGDGEVSFEEVNERGEQSLYDSTKNGGRNAIIPLSGAFSWSRTLISRPTPGIPFALTIGYSSANAFNDNRLGTFNPFDDASVGDGWRHSFQTRVLPASAFDPQAGFYTVGLMAWNGSIETWDLTNGVYRTRHGEYRGELVPIVQGFFEIIGMEWTSPNRLVYRFESPLTGGGVTPTMAGRLLEIRDFYSNSVQVLWNETVGIVTQVIDTAGGTYDFAYDGSFDLTNVSFLGWSAGLEQDLSNRLVRVTWYGPDEYQDVGADWEIEYNGKGVLSTIVDPNGNDAVRVTYDDYGRKTEVRDALDRTTKFEYGVPDIRQTTRTDPADNQWLDSYDRRHRLLAAEDPLGNTTRYSYDARGNIASVTEPLGWKTTYAYDERSNRIAQTNALGEVATWEYHGFFNKPKQVTDALGWQTHFAHDAGGSVTSTWDSIGILAVNTYTSNGLLESATDANGNVSRFTYGRDGFLMDRMDPASNVTSYAKNELDWTLAVTDAIHRVTTFSYDEAGRVIHAIDPILREFSTTYDRNGNALSQVNAKGQVTSNVYDAANQRIETYDRAGEKWRTTFNSRGLVEDTFNPYNKRTRRTYDSAGRLITVEDALGNQDHTEYDVNGNVTATVDRLGRRWTKGYDPLNRVVRSTDPLGNTSLTAYDSVGRVQSRTTPRGYVSQNAYDGRGRLTNWIDTAGFRWGYEYDPVGNITNIVDALGGRYAMTYGPRNERLSEKNQDSFRWEYAYDQLLRLTNSVDPNGIEKAITYDRGGRIDFVSYSTGRIDDYRYDANDNLAELTRAGDGLPVDSELAYDEMDRVASYEDNFGQVVAYSYDKAGRLETTTYPDNGPGTRVLTYSYDDLNRLTRQTDWDGREMAYTYDRIGRLLTRTYPNGIVQTNGLDEAGRLTGLKFEAPGADPLIALEYAYDQNGNRTTSSDAGTLIWTMPDFVDETATYTDSGRLIQRTDALDPTHDTLYAYDDGGNMTNAASDSRRYRLTYDEQNRTTSLHYETPTTTNDIVNRYDALGRRVSRTLDGTETRYVLDVAGGMERILCDMNDFNWIRAWYVHGPGGLCYKVDAADNLTCYHADGTGHIIALTDDQTNVVAQYAYTDYGRLLPGSTADSNPYRYVGSLGVMTEVADLCFMRARYYSSDAATFLSTDPVRNIGPGGRPLAYVYASCSPLGRIDPAGLDDFAKKHGITPNKKKNEKFRKYYDEVQKAGGSIKYQKKKASAKRQSTKARKAIERTGLGEGMNLLEWQVDYAERLFQNMLNVTVGHASQRTATGIIQGGEEVKSWMVREVGPHAAYDLGGAMVEIARWIAEIAGPPLQEVHRDSWSAWIVDHPIETMSAGVPTCLPGWTTCYESQAVSGDDSGQGDISGQSFSGAQVRGMPAAVPALGFFGHWWSPPTTPVPTGGPWDWAIHLRDDAPWSAGAPSSIAAIPGLGP